MIKSRSVAASRRCVKVEASAIGEPYARDAMRCNICLRYWYQISCSDLVSSLARLAGLKAQIASAVTIAAAALIVAAPADAGVILEQPKLKKARDARSRYPSTVASSRYSRGSRI